MAARSGPIQRLIALCARRRGLTLLTIAAAFVWGVASLRQTPLDALPDLSDVQVIVFSEWPVGEPGPGRGTSHVADLPRVLRDGSARRERAVISGSRSST